MKYLLRIAVLLTLMFNSTIAGPTLKSADLVVVGFNSDLDDQLALLALADIPAGSVIFITDEGWDDDDLTYNGSEDVFRWTVHENGISTGAIIRFTNESSSTMEIDNNLHGTIILYHGSLDMDLSSSGDQVFIYQTENDEHDGEIQRLSSEGIAEPGMIYALNFDGSVPQTNGWLNAGNPHNGSATQAPDNMTIVTEQGGLGNAFGLLSQLDTYYWNQGTQKWGFDTGEYDNYRYKGSTDGADKNIWLQRIHTTTNWMAATSDTLGVYAGVLSVNTFSVNPAMPVELTSFTGTTIDGKVNLTWQTATEVNNYGFEIEKQESGVSSQNSEWMNIGFVDGNGNSNSPKQYSFVDESADGQVKYRLKQIDNDGTYEYSKTIEVEAAAPVEFSLAQNYPNPFNPSTTIKFTIPVGNEHLRSVLKVHDILGNEIATLIDENKPAGNYEINFDASNLSSGIYFYSLTTGSFKATNKMILMK